jgi:hypothetical protein
MADGDGAGLVLPEAFELARRLFGGLLVSAPTT